MKLIRGLYVGLMVLGISHPSFAADRFTIGIVGAMSGASGLNGVESRQGVELALKRLNGKLGNLPTKVIVQDDQSKPDQGRQIVEKFMKQDHVDVVIGAGLSNVMLAIYRPVTSNHTILISAIAGPSQIAGKGCDPYFFNTSFQGDNFSEAMGSYLQESGKQKIYLMAPDYVAGHDVLTGFKRFYKGQIAGEVYTTPGQLDYSAELAQLRAANPGAAFVFYAGGFGVQFVKQYAQAGLNESIPLYTAYTVDSATLPAMGSTAVGATITTNWSDELKNKANEEFVTAYAAEHGRKPSEFAAYGYDTINLLNSAIARVQGNIADKTAFLAAIEKADFASVREHFGFAADHFPIQDFYKEQVVQGTDGKPKIELGQVVMKSRGNAYVDACKMK